ncbi:DUF1631 domain-containing protein [Halopseudomonas phragmitis]|uniref:DUF1631 domain-containing protein n=1 Tax=Halopseudomonas phragmitis TaxID=1931241 RepID=A0A1V0B9N3_9GAMM|nr:DUF1631 domain-containing protein [Halopseudomonas phragmitis]AQZ96601.1 hypothetical protein BVH74_18400 [Halopseudomonas phragmitis]
MSQDSKVVHIGGVRRSSEPVPVSTLPTLLLPVRDKALGYLRATLAALFDNADDSLFEMADRAGSNADQTLFFEAMRLVRLQRHAIEKSCTDGLVRELEELNRPEVSPVGGLSFELDTLALVQPDELEQSVALDSMVGRVTARNQLPLAHLATRINSLVKRNIEERSNPLGPALLAKVFADSLVTLQLDIKVRLIIFKLFERYVFNPVDQLYAELNEQLIAAGIMPDLRLAQVGRGAVRSAPGTGSVERGGIQVREQEEQQILSLFSDLIGSWRHASGDAALSALGTPGAVPLPSHELLSVLAQLPAGDLAAEDMGGAGLRTRVQQLLNSRRQATGEARTLNRIDDDVINLVSMLFDFILDDNELPAALKAMIGRLQLPILRVAIADKSFFSQSAHPARRLLNELARATLGWSDHDDLRRDQLHGLLESIVERLLADSQPGPELFEALYGELTGFVRSEQRRSERIEQRTRDAELGRARIEAARSEVARSLNSLLIGRVLPVFVVDLLRDTWSQVMQITWLREGGEAPAWRQVVAVAEQLVAGIEPSDEPLERRQSMHLAVRRALQKGFALIGQDDAHSNELLQRLEGLQARVLDQTVSRVEAVVAEPAFEEPESDQSVISEPEPAPPAVEICEPVMPESESEAVPVLVDDLPSVKASAWIESLHTGGWFELALSSEQPVQRCKLAAIIAFSGKYIFVNRNGLKVAEFTTAALAQHYDAGLVRLLDDNQLFDRALESVIGNLRKIQAARH